MMNYEFTPVCIPPEKPDHYLTISDMNWYHGGCFDENEEGVSLSYRIAYWNNGWNDPFVVAWCALPGFPEVYKVDNRKLLERRKNNLKPFYGTECEVR